MFKFPTFDSLRDPSGAQTPILATLKALVLRVMHTKFGVKIGPELSERLNILIINMFSPKWGSSSRICTAINVLVTRVMHNKFDQNEAKTF